MQRLLQQPYKLAVRESFFDWLGCGVLRVPGARCAVSHPGPLVRTGTLNIGLVSISPRVSSPRRVHTCIFILATLPPNTSHSSVSSACPRGTKHEPAGKFLRA